MNPSRSHVSPFEWCYGGQNLTVSPESPQEINNFMHIFQAEAGYLTIS